MKEGESSAPPSETSDGRERSRTSATSRLSCCEDGGAFHLCGGGGGVGVGGWVQLHTSCLIGQIERTRSS